MILESNFKEKKEERKLAGLVALAAQEKKSLAPCLSDEEMALLVNGNCSAQEKERGWAHLSQCEQCYEQWYCLKMEGAGDAKKSGVVYLLRPRNFALFGSAIAVAASVALFLNIPQAPLPDHAMQESAMPSLQLTRELRKVVPNAMEEEMADQEVSLKEAPRLMSTAPRATENMLGTADIKMTKTEPIQEWLEAVREGCLKKQTGTKFWGEIVFRGDQLLEARRRVTRLNEENARVFEILQLIPRSYKKDLMASRCEQILVELAEDEKSR